MKQSTLVLLSILSIFIISCGKDPSNSDRAQKELSATIQESEKTLTPLAGHYEGTLTSPLGKVHHVALHLIPTIMIIQNPGRNDVTEMPTLGGNLNFYYIDKDPKSFIPLAQFTNTIYEPATGHIRLNGSMNVGGSIGQVLNTIDGYVQGNSISGHVFNSSRGDLGLLQVTKQVNLIVE